MVIASLLVTAVYLQGKPIVSQTANQKESIATTHAVVTQEVDAMKDFRYPKSVVEEAHDYITGAIYELQQNIAAKASHKECATRVHDLLGHTSKVIETHKAAQTRISEKDKEYLQSMIDRINSLINYLEEDDDVEVSQKAGELKQLSGEISHALD